MFLMREKLHRVCSSTYKHIVGVVALLHTFPLYKNEKPAAVMIAPSGVGFMSYFGVYRYYYYFTLCSVPCYVIDGEILSKSLLGLLYEGMMMNNLRGNNGVSELLES